MPEKQGTAPAGVHSGRGGSGSKRSLRAAPCRIPAGRPAAPRKGRFRYFVTRSSQRTIESMTSIERPQAATKTVQVVHIGVWM